MNVKGQIIGSGESAVRHLYIDTWHTDKWASPDNGVNWLRIPGEAAWLEMERAVATASDAQVVYNYNSTPNTLSGDLMAGGVNFIDAPGAISPPIILQKGIFAETAASATATTMFCTPNLTRSTIGSPGWTLIGNFRACVSGRCTPLSTSDAPILGGYLGREKTNAVVYQPHDSGLAVVSGIVANSGGRRSIGPGAVTYSQMKWRDPSGALQDVLQGIAWTPFVGLGKFAVIGVDAQFPSHLVIPDIKNNQVMQSFDGGNTWTPIRDLVGAVTADSRDVTSFTFAIDRGNGFQSMVSSISFYPENSNLVILGTVENGLFFSLDRAATWRRIPGSEHITNVVALYWRSANSVLVGSNGRGLFEIQIRYSLPRSAMGLICGDCRFLPTVPIKVAGLGAPPLGQIAPQPVSAMMQENFDEAIMVLDGRINGTEVSQGRLQKLWVTPGSTTYRFGSPNSSLKLSIEERSGFAGFQGLPQADQLRGQGQVVKGLGFTNGNITQVIYGQKQSETPVPPPPGPVVLPQETELRLKGPYLRIFGPEIILGTTAAGKTFDLQGFMFQPDTPVEVLVDGRATSQLRADAQGEFATRIVAPNIIGPHDIRARQMLNGKEVQAGIGFHVNNSDAKNEGKVPALPSAAAAVVRRTPTIVIPATAPPVVTFTPPATVTAPPATVTAPPATVTAIPAAATALPKLIPAADLIGAAAVNGGEMRLVSLASPRDPEAKSLEWSGVSNGNQLTLKVAWQGAASVVLYASVLRSPGAGSLRVLVNGRELGAPLDLAFSRETTSKLALGQVELQPGENTVTFVAMPSQEGAQMRVSLLSLSIEK